MWVLMGARIVFYYGTETLPMLSNIAYAFMLMSLVITIVDNGYHAGDTQRDRALSWRYCALATALYVVPYVDVWLRINCCR